MANNYGDITHRMLRQLEEEDTRPNGAPRCEGHGRRVELALYQRCRTDGGSAMVNYCGECRALAMVELEDESC